MAYRTFFTAALTFASMMLAQQPGQPGEFDKALAEGRSFLAGHQVLEAAKAGMRAISADSSRWEGFLLVATAMAEKKSYADALPFYYEAFVRAPQNKRQTLEDLIEHTVAAKLTERPAGMEGEWQATIDVGATKQRVSLHVSKNPKGILSSTLDFTTDQGSTGIVVELTTLTGNSVHLEIPAIGGKFDGILGMEGREIRGSLAQRGSILPLVWKRP